jgi:methanogen homoaconitase small subunit
VVRAASIEARPDFAESAQPGDIIVAGRNFGCGSSREYAPLAPKRREVAVIVAPSFARIFFRNGVNVGIPLFVAPDVAEALQDGEEAGLDLAARSLTADGRAYDLPELPRFAQEIIDVGGVVSFVREHGTFPRLSEVA